MYILSKIKSYNISTTSIVSKKYCTLKTSKNAESRTKYKLQKVFHVMHNSQNADFAISFLKYKMSMSLQWENFHAIKQV